MVVVVSEQRHVISIANNGFLKRNYNQKPEDFQNEQRARSIQKALRKDLTRLLHGDVRFFGGADEETDEIERKSFFPEIRFIWSFGNKPSRSDKPKGRTTRNDKARTNTAGNTGSRYRVLDVKKNSGSAVRADETDARDGLDERNGRDERYGQTDTEL